PPGNYPPPPPGYGAYSGAPGNAVGQLPQEAYTSWLTRVGAYLIDFLPVLVLYGIPSMIAGTTADRECVSSSTGFECTVTPSSAGATLMFLGWLAALIFGIWNFGYRQGTTGSSIGKSVLKFKVVSESTGQPIGFGMSLVRQLAHVVDSIILGIGYLFPLWDAKRQTIADKIMSTVCLPIR
ncbi:RDD family protein, partial [Mycolicibacter hiberniae]